MKVYELSKKHNISDKDMIKVLKTLKVQGSKQLDSFSTLSVKEINLVENYFDNSKKKIIAKEVKPEKKGELLIVKKRKDEEILTKEKQNNNEETQKESIKKESPIVKNESDSSKKVIKISKRVVVKKKNNEMVSTPQTNAAKSKIKSSSHAKTERKDYKSKNIGENKADNSDVKILVDSTKNEKELIQINRSPKREFTKEGKKKEDAHWKKKSSKRVAYEKIERLKEEKEKFFTKKNKIKESKTISIPKSIEIMETITVSDLAKKLNVKAGEIIAKLISMGVMATINQVIDSDTANIVAIEYNCETKVVSLYDETIIEEAADSQGDLVFRPPIVTVMGHVDHGKTRLLDAIRETDVVASEAGGITQHIGAYQINIKSGSIVFLDTPGHEAFTAMRARGAKVTDIVVLVVAGDDGVMPQTIEAINHAREAEVPIVVAINKIDSPKVNLDRVKQQLADLDLLPEEWGGKTMIVEVSALKKMNLDKLLDAILLEAEMLELRANPNRKAYGTIIESRIDIGRGSVATVLIQNGTLKIGDSFVSGVYSGKVRALFNDKGQPVNMALPSTPVEVLGLDGVPNAGDPFNVIEEEKIAKQIAQKRQELKRINNAKNVKKITLDDLSRQIKEGEIKDLKIVLKGDVQGSIEALKDAFHKLSNSEINVKVIHSSTGAINENDVMLASASNAIIVGFHVHPNSKAFNLAHRENVEIRKHSIIYDAIDSIKNAMEGMLSPELREEITGQAEVRELYKVPKVGVIAGCYVQSGKILKNSRLRIIREGIEVYEGDVLALKRFKDDVTEVKEKFECGISIHNYQDIKVGDIIEGFIIKEFAKTLS